MIRNYITTSDSGDPQTVTITGLQFAGIEAFKEFEILRHTARPLGLYYFVVTQSFARKCGTW